MVGNAERMVAASCPAGPAFEGGGIEYGMPAYPGAIESMKWNGSGQFSYTTIDEETPQGLCGSGLISLLAELRRNDQMSPKGVFAERKQRLMSLLPEHGITFSREDAEQSGTSESCQLLWTIYCPTAFWLCAAGHHETLFSRRLCELC